MRRRASRASIRPSCFSWRSQTRRLLRVVGYLQNMISIDFDLAYEYVSTGDGIPVPVRIGHAGKTVELTARLDTGAAHCLFHRSYADLLDIDWDQGLPQNYRTGAGNFRAYGHELALNTWGLQWSAMVYFHEAGSPNSNYVGRTGWLDRVRSWALARNYHTLLTKS